MKSKPNEYVPRPGELRKMMECNSPLQRQASQVFSLLKGSGRVFSKVVRTV